MHSQQLLAEIKNSLFTDPQKCIKILSNKSFLNNLFYQHLLQLVLIIETPLNKLNKENKNLSYACPQTISRESTLKKSQELNAQLIVCIYSIIIMKSTSKSIVASQQTPIFNSKLAIQTLSKIHKQIKLQDIRKIVTALLLKIPSFTNHKTIIRDISPEFISIKTMQKASSAFRNQCPNIYQQKLIAHKDTQWGRFLDYKPLKLDVYAESFKKLLTVGASSTDANALIQIRQELRKEFQFLLKRIDIINKEEFFIYEFCEKFSELYKIRLQFSKLLDGQRFAAESKNLGSSKILPSYNINELRLKILLEGKNQLLIILTQLVKKLSTYCTRKLKWLFEFITQRVEIYGLQQMGISSIQQADVYMQKITELKLLIKLTHTYYKQFGEGLFPEEKLKAILFTQEYSFYKMIEALLYNQYEFAYSSESSRIVNYQKTKKVSQESKNKKTLIKTINVNSKSLNINPHYDLVFQKVIQQLTQKHGQSYFWIRELIQQALKFMCSYYKNSETYFYGGNLITMIQNCKNAEIPKQKIVLFLKEIKSILYPTKRMVKQGLQFFCQEVFQNYISKKKHLEENQQKNSSTFNICQTPFITIHSKINDSSVQNQSNKSIGLEKEKGVIRKTKSYDMMVEGWSKVNQDQNEKEDFNAKIPELNGEGSEIFYSIRENGSNENKDDKSQESRRNQEVKQNSQLNHGENNGQGEEFILTPQF